MPKTVLTYIFLFFLLVICQAVIFNNLILFNTAIALVFLYLLIELPVTIPTNGMLAIGFVLGLSVDVFQDTPGLNALCCTVLAFIRRPMFHLYVPRDEDFSGKRLSIKTLGTAAFLKYMLTAVLIYCILYFSIEAFSYADIARLVMRIVASTLFTFVVIYAIDSLTVTRREKRL